MKKQPWFNWLRIWVNLRLAGLAWLVAEFRGDWELTIQEIHMWDIRLSRLRLGWTRGGLHVKIGGASLRIHHPFTLKSDPSYGSAFVSGIQSLIHSVHIEELELGGPQGSWIYAWDLVKTGPAWSARQLNGWQNSQLELEAHHLQVDQGIFLEVARGSLEFLGNFVEIPCVPGVIHLEKLSVQGSDGHLKTLEIWRDSLVCHLCELTWVNSQVMGESLFLHLDLLDLWESLEPGWPASAGADNPEASSLRLQFEEVEIRGPQLGLQLAGLFFDSPQSYGFRDLHMFSNTHLLVTLDKVEAHQWTGLRVLMDFPTFGLWRSYVDRLKVPVSNGTADAPFQLDLQDVHLIFRCWTSGIEDFPLSDWMGADHLLWAARGQPEFWDPFDEVQPWPTDLILKVESLQFDGALETSRLSFWMEDRQIGEAHSFQGQPGNYWVAPVRGTLLRRDLTNIIDILNSLNLGAPEGSPKSGHQVRIPKVQILCKVEAENCMTVVVEDLKVEVGVGLQIWANGVKVSRESEYWRAKNQVHLELVDNKIRVQGHLMEARLNQDAAFVIDVVLFFVAACMASTQRYNPGIPQTWEVDYELGEMEAEIWMKGCPLCLVSRSLQQGRLVFPPDAMDLTLNFKDFSLTRGDELIASDWDAQVHFGSQRTPLNQMEQINALQLSISLFRVSLRLTARDFDFLHNLQELCDLSRVVNFKYPTTLPSYLVGNRYTHPLNLDRLTSFQPNFQLSLKGGDIFLVDDSSEVLKFSGSLEVSFENTLKAQLSHFSVHYWSFRNSMWEPALEPTSILVQDRNCSCQSLLINLSSDFLSHTLPALYRFFCDPDDQAKAPNLRLINLTQSFYHFRVLNSFRKSKQIPIPENTDLCLDEHTHKSFDSPYVRAELELNLKVDLIDVSRNYLSMLSSQHLCLTSRKAQNQTIYLMEPVLIFNCISRALEVNLDGQDAQFQPFEFSDLSDLVKHFIEGNPLLEAVWRRCRNDKLKISVGCTGMGDHFQVSQGRTQFHPHRVNGDGSWSKISSPSMVLRVYQVKVGPLTGIFLFPSITIYNGLPIPVWFKVGSHYEHSIPAFGHLQSFDMGKQFHLKVDQQWESFHASQPELKLFINEVSLQVSLKSDVLALVFYVPYLVHDKTDLGLRICRDGREAVNQHPYYLVDHFDKITVHHQKWVGALNLKNKYLRLDWGDLRGYGLVARFEGLPLFGFAGTTWVFVGPQVMVDNQTGLALTLDEGQDQKLVPPFGQSPLYTRGPRSPHQVVQDTSIFRFKVKASKWSNSLVASPTMCGRVSLLVAPLYYFRVDVRPCPKTGIIFVVIQQGTDFRFRVSQNSLNVKKVILRTDSVAFVGQPDGKIRKIGFPTPYLEKPATTSSVYGDVHRGIRNTIFRATEVDERPFSRCQQVDLEIQLKSQEVLSLRFDMDSGKEIKGRVLQKYRALQVRLQSMDSYQLLDISRALETQDTNPGEVLSFAISNVGISLISCTLNSECFFVDLTSANIERKSYRDHEEYWISLEDCQVDCQVAGRYKVLFSSDERRESDTFLVGHFTREALASPDLVITAIQLCLAPVEVRLDSCVFKTIETFVTSPSHRKPQGIRVPTFGLETPPPNRLVNIDRLDLRTVLLRFSVMAEQASLPYFARAFLMFVTLQPNVEIREASLILKALEATNLCGSWKVVLDTVFGFYRRQIINGVTKALHHSSLLNLPVHYPKKVALSSATLAHKVASKLLSHTKFHRPHPATPKKRYRRRTPRMVFCNAHFREFAEDDAKVMAVIRDPKTDVGKLVAEYNLRILDLHICSRLMVRDTCFYSIVVFTQYYLLVLKMTLPFSADKKVKPLNTIEFTVDISSLIGVRSQANCVEFFWRIGEHSPNPPRGCLPFRSRSSSFPGVVLNKEWECPGTRNENLVTLGDTEEICPEDGRAVIECQDQVSAEVLVNSIVKTSADKKYG